MKQTLREDVHAAQVVIALRSCAVSASIRERMLFRKEIFYGGE